ncbi:transcriptional regulator with PAS, ATPase and Fis domain [Desulfitispora alkaliphila]|uniref:sigma-54 interaction domain-containing protein n=1 Tax=Desulfitispora alkaliphila TaxID=622674 RepID=UPI003D2117B7
MISKSSRLDSEEFVTIINNMYDEVLIYDNNYNIVYINQASSRHYSSSPEEMMGKSFFDFVDNNWWEPSILPIIYKEKRPIAIKQSTYTGIELFTIAVPIFDENKQIKYVVMNVRDNVNEIDLYNPNYVFIDQDINSKLIPIAKSEAMIRVMKLVNKIGQIDTTCILTGESGTGKSMIANYMHSIGPRKNYPFINLNCASIPGELFESELFGYAKGAFTGAHTSGKKGLLETANNGTILLDEISELTMAAQAKLLLVLQDKEFIPVGSNKPIKVNVKIIAATNKNLKNMVQMGAFREDLYYRLNVIDIYIPPLRKRKEDIPYLVESFLEEFCKRYKVKRKLTKNVLAVLTENDWKGNVRELRHMIERLVVTVDHKFIEVSDLPKNMFGIFDTEATMCNVTEGSFDERISKYEALIIQDAYEKHKTSRKVADYLSISQTKANNLIRKYVKNSDK